jgi:hypothetical protein
MCRVHARRARRSPECRSVARRGPAEPGAIEKPFQNWTRESAALIGAVNIRTDFTVPVDRVRQKVNEIVQHSPLRDGRVQNVQAVGGR